MKRQFSFLFFCIATMLCSSGCRWLPGGSDSEYKGTKYVFTRPYKFPPITNPYADSVTYEGVELGRRLFYDKHLSKNGKKSCASCHLQQYAFSDSGRAFSENETGLTRRNAPPLQNLLWTKDFFWDGKVSDLATQADDAAHNELAINTDITLSYLKADTSYTALFKKAFGRPGDITMYKVNKALQQFTLTLISCNAKFDKVMQQKEKFTPAEERGYNLFFSDTAGCFRCHVSGGGSSLLFTDLQFKNNGLDRANTIIEFADSGRGGITHKAYDYGKFKVPSFRNVALTGPYMHNGRFKTLKQVINFYNDSTQPSATLDPTIMMLFRDKKSLHMNTRQKNDLLSFMQTLTDSAFLTNPAFSDPFK